MAKTKAIQGELVVDEIAIRSQFQFDETQIATTKQRISSIAVIDRPSFEAAWEIRQDLRGLRVGIDKERKRLTEKARSYTGMVNDVAKSILEHIIPVEYAVVAKIAQYEMAEAERKKAVEIARQKALQVRIDALMAVEHVPNSFLLGLMPEDEYQTLLAESTKAFEAKKIADEQERLAMELAADELRASEKAERDFEEAKRVADRMELDRIRKDQEIERKRLAEERAKLAEEARLQREEAQRIERAEDARVAAIRSKELADEREHFAELAKRNAKALAEAMQPDVKKIRAFGDLLRSLTYPITSTDEGQMFLLLLKTNIDKQAEYCEAFGNGN